jgi:hypothetical protein
MPNPFEEKFLENMVDFASPGSWIVSAKAQNLCIISQNFSNIFISSSLWQAGSNFISKVETNCSDNHRHASRPQLQHQIRRQWRGASWRCNCEAVLKDHPYKLSATRG